MPRSLVIGNGQVLATFDEHLQMRDLYFPYVGMEDHTAYGDAHRVGVFVEGRGFSWVSDGTWDISPRYRPQSLVGDSRMRNDTLGLEIIAEDYVHPFYNILVRHLRVRSTDGERKKATFFFHHNLFIYGDKQKDTAFYEPFTNSVIHYRASRYFLVGGETSDPVGSPPQDRSPSASILHSREKLRPCGLTGYSIGKANYQGLEGTWRDAEDGVLANTAIDQGSVDSTVGIACQVHETHETEVSLWMCFGKSLQEVIDLQQHVLTEGQDHLLNNCHNYWKSWVQKSTPDFGSLSAPLVDLYDRSLLLMRLHADNRGGIVAAADSDIMAFNRDTYTYVWPRDGAFICLAFDLARYMEAPRRFFEFCSRVQSPDGYLLHKYNPDGSLGSSWHPWFANSEAQMPIQEDETALVIHALWHHFERTQDFEFLQEMYEKFVGKAAQFLTDFREPETGLPLPSYDPWEERHGVFTYTVSSVVAGLTAAAKICHVLGHHAHSQRYQTAADETRQALLFHLFDEPTGRFLKMIRRKNGKTVERDATIDASIGAIWRLHVLPVTDPRVIGTMTQLREALTVRTGIGGMARYVGDVYHAKTPTSLDVPGNPWVITTLWDAQWTIARAESLQDLEPARTALNWAQKLASETGILPEQFHPFTGQPLSVAPLAWSHAVYIETVLQFCEKERLLKAPANDACGKAWYDAPVKSATAIFAIIIAAGCLLWTPVLARPSLRELHPDSPSQSSSSALVAAPVATGSGAEAAAWEMRSERAAALAAFPASVLAERTTLYAKDLALKTRIDTNRARCAAAKPIALPALLACERAQLILEKEEMLRRGQEVMDSPGVSADRQMEVKDTSDALSKAMQSLIDGIDADVFSEATLREARGNLLTRYRTPAFVALEKAWAEEMLVRIAPLLMNLKANDPFTAIPCLLSVEATLSDILAANTPETIIPLADQAETALAQCIKTAGTPQD